MKLLNPNLDFSQAAFVFYFKIRAKNNFMVDFVRFYITEMSFACYQDLIIPFHTLNWEIQDGRRGIMKSYKCSYLCNKLR